MAAPAPVWAASHREAPLTSLDHPADITDFFAFVSYDDSSKVTFILDVDPLLEPANGPNYFPFDPEVLYTIKVDNNYDAIEDITLEFRFKTEIRAPGVFTGFVGAGGGIPPLIPPAVTSLDGPGAAGLSLRQSYTVTMVKGTGPNAVRTDLTPQNPLFAVPSNVGPRTMPNYPALARQGIYNLAGGFKVFAGTVDDPFYIDLGATFDSLNFRAGATVSGSTPLLTAFEDSSTINMAADTLSGYNVNAIAIEVPVGVLTTPGKPNIGTWGATYRQATTVRSAGPNAGSGDWVQVQRMANALINEVVIGTGDKDKWSRSQPKDDAQFAAYALDPVPPKVINTVFGLQVPPAPRTDLLPLVQYLPILTGDPSLPKGPVADLLRLNTSIAATDASTRSRLGVLGGDSAGYPNGRRVSDDVTDISLRVVAGALAGLNYALGDGVNKNDVGYQETFPYVQWANSGRNRRHIDPGESGCNPSVVSSNSGRTPCPVN